MPYCTNCGCEVTEDMFFCPQCGKKLVIPKAGLKVDKIRDYTVEAEEKEPEDILDRTIKKGKLYKQWVAYAGLPAEEIRSTRTSRDIPVSGERSSRSLTLMYILLGVCIGIVCTALAFFLIKPF